MSRPEQKPQNPPDSAQRCVQRAQNERTEDAEIERRPERDGGIEEQPQPPSANIERQRQQAQQQKQRVQQVRRDGQRGDAASWCAEQIVDDAAQKPEQQRRRELRRLQAQRKLHQPKRRAKKPPAGTGSS